MCMLLQQLQRPLQGWEPALHLAHCYLFPSYTHTTHECGRAEPGLD